MLFLLVCAGKEVPFHVLCVVLLPAEDGCALLQVIGCWRFAHRKAVELAAVGPIAGYYLVFAFFQLSLLLPEGLVFLPKFLVSGHMFLYLLKIYGSFLLFEVIEGVIFALLVLDLGAVVSFLAFFEEWFPQ